MYSYHHYLLFCPYRDITIVTHFVRIFLATGLYKEVIDDDPVVKTLIDHPQQVCMSYGEHCRFSLTLAGEPKMREEYEYRQSNE